MRDAGLDEVFTEHFGYRCAKRPQLKLLLKTLKTGDRLHVHGIDHLASDLTELRRIIEGLISRGVSVKFYKEALFFDGADEAAQNLQRHILGLLADFQCNHTQALLEEERVSNLYGKRVGASMKLGAREIQEIRARVSRGANKSALAREFGISRPTLYSILVDV
jgi:DNA invertase Pin-like site-specific DNA recombinase